VEGDLAAESLKKRRETGFSGFEKAEKISSDRLV
jgi:hypothetical protein